MNTQTINDLIKKGGDNDTAITGSGQTPLNYGALRKLVHRTVSSLRKMGVNRNDRVAIVLPNGPEMAATFISVAAGATAAPLNPNYRREEFSFYLQDLNARVLLVEKGSESEAIHVAHSLNVPVHEILVSEGAPAGMFRVSGFDEENENQLLKDQDYATSSDIALVLHTSGTTSRPKIVPLTQANICNSAINISSSLDLSIEDRCLNIMPLFHIHGLIAAVLSTLSAGASIYCSSGFNALQVFKWFSSEEPTWFTAVPTMHQAILSRANRNSDILEKMKLRLIRSSSSSLAPQVMAQLEETFHCPVIEAYGMTEAAHQMASNPLPPSIRKPGSVGLAAGPEIRIMDDKGNFLSSETEGEIVIRGSNVTNGYENNPTANSDAFVNGWFRTGDQGVIDGDGYLSITGRLKEIINRGGEKISPREVDEVLLDHPQVNQVLSLIHI